jgi:hypothetical protein
VYAGMWATAGGGQQAADGGRRAASVEGDGRQAADRTHHARSAARGRCERALDRTVVTVNMKQEQSRSEAGRRAGAGSGRTQNEVQKRHELGTGCRWCCHVPWFVDVATRDPRLLPASCPLPDLFPSVPRCQPRFSPPSTSHTIAPCPHLAPPDLRSSALHPTVPVRRAQRRHARSPRPTTPCPFAAPNDAVSVRRAQRRRARFLPWCLLVASNGACSARPMTRIFSPTRSPSSEPYLPRSTACPSTSHGVLLFLWRSTPSCPYTCLVGVQRRLFSFVSFVSIW